MPSAAQLPSIDELVDVATGTVRGRHDSRANVRRGSNYDVLAGTPALIWSRQAQRDKDLFRVAYFDHADGDALTTRVAEQFGIDRVLDSLGAGTASLRRASTAAGAGTIWQGTRIKSSRQTYRVTQDTPVTATATNIVVPIEATVVGPEGAIDVSTGTVDDPLWDSTWTVSRILCAEGTTFEKAEAFRARVRTERKDARVGYEAKIVAACKAAGAENVVLFRSTWSGSDAFVSYCYVGDASFSSTAALTRDCLIALEGARVLGCDLFVGALATAQAYVSGTVYLREAPERLGIDRIRQDCSSALLNQFAGVSGGFSYTRASLTGAMRKAVPDIDYVTYSLPASDVLVTGGSPSYPTFPATLTRYRLLGTNINLTFERTP